MLAHGHVTAAYRGMQLLRTDAYHCCAQTQNMRGHEMPLCASTEMQRASIPSRYCSTPCRCSGPDPDVGLVYSSALSGRSACDGVSLRDAGARLLHRSRLCECKGSCAEVACRSRRRAEPGRTRTGRRDRPRYDAQTGAGRATGAADAAAHADEAHPSHLSARSSARPVAQDGRRGPQEEPASRAHPCSQGEAATQLCTLPLSSPLRPPPISHTNSY